MFDFPLYFPFFFSWPSTFFPSFSFFNSDPVHTGSSGDAFSQTPHFPFQPIIHHEWRDISCSPCPINSRPSPYYLTQMLYSFPIPIPQNMGCVAYSGTSPFSFVFLIF